MGDGTKEHPYTREDVLRLIEENGGTAEGLDLSRKFFEEGIDLSKLNLRKIILKESFLKKAHFEESILTGSHLEGVYLEFAHLENAELHFARLERALLWSAQFSSDTRLEDIDWGNYILWEEIAKTYTTALISYRRLKNLHTNAGMYDVAGKFYYREMEAKRKARKWRKEPHLKLWSLILRILCGYGENWERVIISAAAVIFGLALIYLAIGTLSPNTFLNSLYYSAVSFTALGYGSWAPQPTGSVKALGAFEAFIGIFMMALFLVTFTRKMTR